MHGAVSELSVITYGCNGHVAVYDKCGVPFVLSFLSGSRHIDQDLVMGDHHPNIAQEIRTLTAKLLPNTHSPTIRHSPGTKLLPDTPSPTIRHSGEGSWQ